MATATLAPAVKQDNRPQSHVEIEILTRALCAAQKHGGKLDARDRAAYLAHVARIRALRSREQFNRQLDGSMGMAISTD